MEIEKLNEPVSDSSHKRAVEKKCYTKDTDKHKEYLKKHKRKIKQIQQLNESQRKSLRKCDEKNDFKLFVEKSLVNLGCLPKENRTLQAILVHR